MLAATLFLALNHLWAWGNHPYRFAINLVFPLAILAALGLRHAPRPLAVVLGVGLLAAAAPQVVLMARNEGLHLRVQSRQKLGAFLSEVRKATDAEPDRSARLLNPPEFHYPEGTAQSALILNASSLPGFVPDYRYILWPERHRNRLALFCSLFPYPHEELHTQLRACDGSYEPALFAIADRRIRTATLPLYRIRYAVSIGPPFNFELPGMAAENQWPLVATTPDRHFLYKVASPDLPGVARASPGVFDESGFRVDLEVAAAGRHLIVLGGRKLAERAPVRHGRRPRARPFGSRPLLDRGRGRSLGGKTHPDPPAGERALAGGKRLRLFPGRGRRRLGEPVLQRPAEALLVLRSLRDACFRFRDGSYARTAFDQEGDGRDTQGVRSLGVAARGLRSHPRT